MLINREVKNIWVRNVRLINIFYTFSEYQNVRISHNEPAMIVKWLVGSKKDLAYFNIYFFINEIF